jgi:outer membrane protein
MKRILLVLCSLLIAGTSIEAQNAKLGHVDSHAVMQSMPELEQAQQALQQYYKELEDAMEGMVREYRTKAQDYQAKMETLTPAIRKAREEELEDLGRRIESFRQTAQQDVQQKEAELQQPIIEKVIAAIEKVGKEHSFTYILEGAPGILLYKATSATDVTNLVKKELGVQ